MKYNANYEQLYNILKRYKVYIDRHFMNSKLRLDIDLR
jgi:hypothetical protein